MDQAKSLNIEDISNLSFCIVVPTYNAGPNWAKWIEGVTSQTIKPEKVLVVDSGSTDSTVVTARESGFQVNEIHKKDFNHGGTRQFGISLLPESDIIIFLTQDAILEDRHSLQLLVKCFTDPQIAAAYGRQLPYTNATHYAKHLRYFNYTNVSHVATYSDISKYGLKSAFLSNSYAAYRRDTLFQVGGFPKDIILGEDMVVGAKLLLQGYAIKYCSEAKVIHSHNYSLAQEFRRYFDIGVFHAQNKWLIEQFGTAEGEGTKYIRSEIEYLLSKSPFLIPLAMLRVLSKYAGYRLGRAERILPKIVKKIISMHRGFWV